MATSAQGMKRPHPAVFLQDFVDVGRPATEVGGRLIAGSDWLTPLAESPGDDGDGVRVSVGPGTIDLVARDVRIKLGEAIVNGDNVVVPMRWEAARHPGLFPVLDGDLEVAPMGADRCRLVFHASYRPPLDSVGWLLDVTLLRRVAESTTRSFLQRVGEVLETEPGD